MISFLLAVIYLAFVSLGLPDALLGSAWPLMHQELGVPVSMAGLVSMVVSLGTITSSIFSDRMTRRFGPGMVTAVSVGLTALALLGYSTATEYWMLLLWAIPYGLGAGSVDAALNNYVAVHYASRHMSWLHCMWGIGASLGPYIMGMALTGGLDWPWGYRIVGLLQILLTAVLLMSLPRWKKTAAQAKEEQPAKPLSFREILAIPGTKSLFTAFFCYCALEQTAILWGSTYFVRHVGLSEELAATLGSLFLAGMTVGRAVNGFLTYRFTDSQLIRMGQGLIAAGVALLFVPVSYVCMAGMMVIGLGCAPIYPCIIHATPAHFGAERSQAIVGIQMASAYVGSLLMPPLFGLAANHLSAGLLPVYLGVLLAVMVLTSERLNRKAK